MNAWFRIGFLCTASLLILVLSSGSLLHALIPHEHAHDTGAVSLLHSSLRHEEQTLIVLPAVAFVWVSIVSLLARAVIARTVAFRSLSSRARSSHLYALSRGVLAYRRFG